MSSALAIGATMRGIAALIDTAVNDAGISTALGGTATTTVLPPDRNDVGGAELSHINLFLYAVTMNAGWRNADRMRDASGNRVAKPPLAVDLHFLMSAYGHIEYEAEMLLGLGMQAIYEQSFLDRGQIANLFASASSDQEKAMATSQLDQQIEQIKIAEHDLSADELYKLWSAFGSKCRPSAAYVATVVLIESLAEVRSAPPVMSRNLGVVALARVRLDDVTPAIFALPGPPVQLTLTGAALNVPGNVVRFRDALVPFDSASPQQGVVTVPAGVPPGINLLQVVREYAIGEPPDKLIGTSNPIAFIVQPTVGAINKITLRGDAGLQIGIAPAATSDQKATLLLDGSLHDFAIDALPEDNAGPTIAFAIPQVPSGTYLVRLRIAGTESVPTFDPVACFTGPTVVV